MNGLNRNLKAEELAAVLKENDYELTEEPLVLDIVETAEGTTGDYALMFMAGNVTFANTSTGKMTRAQLRAKGWTERTMIARGMEVVSLDWIEENGIEVGSTLTGQKLRVMESTEPFYDEQSHRISSDGTARVTDDEDGDFYYQTAILVDDDEFKELKGHDTLKTMKLPDWEEKYGEEVVEEVAEKVKVKAVKAAGSKPSNPSKRIKARNVTA